MTIITVGRFDRSNIRVIEAAIKVALAQVGEDYGVFIDLQRGDSFSDTSFSGKFEARVLQANGKPATDPMLKLMCDRFGLDPEKTSRDGYTLVAYKSSRPRFPWSIRDRAGADRKATQGWVEARFKKDPLIHTGMPPAPARPNPASPSNPSLYDATF